LLGHSMLDVLFFMPPVLIYYMVLVAWLEDDAIKRKGFGSVDGFADRVKKFCSRKNRIKAIRN